MKALGNSGKSWKPPETLGITPLLYVVAGFALFISCPIYKKEGFLPWCWWGYLWRVDKGCVFGRAKDDSPAPFTIIVYFRP